MSNGSETVEVQLARIEAGVAAIKETATRLETAVTAFHAFQLQMIEHKATVDGWNVPTRLNSHSERIKKLEDKDSERRGAKWAIGAIGAAIGIIGMGGIAAILRAMGV